MIFYRHFFLALVATQSAWAASFDCVKASTSVEKLICSDQLLGRLDETLAKNYQGMLYADFGGSKSSLRKSQMMWLAERHKCKNRDCLVDMYRNRIDKTCDYGVVSGVHPVCTMSEDVK
jgi:uncharacterized protein